MSLEHKKVKEQVMKYETVFFVLSVVVLSSPLMAESSDRVLFSSKRADACRQWQTVNDGVMGGRSDGRIKINENKKMEFYGTLSLANNGGFASVRSKGSNLGLAKGDSIVVRVRGDGREYSLNLYTPRRRTAFSYRAKFKTKKNEWTEVRVPLDEFVATSFGRVQRSQTLDPTEVNGLGILLGDKQAGPFKLEVDWINASKMME
jgi:monofunctional biosynthetic peptidoglycan transglycosylase